jgi:hypothetical protein
MFSKFRGRSLEIFCLFCERGSLGGKENGSLESQLPLINCLGGWRCVKNRYILIIHLDLSYHFSLKTSKVPIGTD